MEYDYTALAADPDGYLNWALGQVGAALSLRTESDTEASWIDAATQLTTSFPDPMVRARFATNCTLRQLLVLAHDEHLAVRLSCIDNPFIIDRDVQVALCEDADPTVANTLLDNVEPCMEACQALLHHPEPRIRARLASHRRRRVLLTALSHDEDQQVRDLAVQAIHTQDLLLNNTSGRIAQNQ